MTEDIEPRGGPDDPWWPDIVTLQTQIDTLNASVATLTSTVQSLQTTVNGIATDNQLIWQHIEGIENIEILQSHVRSVYSNVRPGPNTEALETEMVTDALEEK